MAAFDLTLRVDPPAALNTAAHLFSRNDRYFPSTPFGEFDLNSVLDTQAGNVRIVGLSPNITSGPTEIGRLRVHVASSATAGDTATVTLEGDLNLGTDQDTPVGPIVVEFRVGSGSPVTPLPTAPYTAVPPTETTEPPTPSTSPTPASTAPATATPPIGSTTPPPTATPSPPAGAGIAQGTVKLQGRSDHRGVRVASEAQSLDTDAAGNYRLDIPAGVREIRFSRSLYLPSRLSNVSVTDGAARALDPITLRGGDTDDSGDVNLFDLVRVGANYSLQPPNDLRADLNEDGIVNLFDLVLVGSNYGISGEQVIDASQRATLWHRLWARVRPDSSAPDHKTVQTAHVSATAPQLVALDGSFTVDVVVHTTEPLQAIELKITYDPLRASLVDVDAGQEGIQAQLGAWGEGAYVAQHDIVQTSGGPTLVLAATQLGPPRVIDEGSLLRVKFRSLGSLGSESAGVQLESATLIDGDGRPLVIDIPAEVR